MAYHSKTQSTGRVALRRTADPRIPHPSWRQTITGSDQGGGQVVNAGEFWTRLGI